MLLGIAIGDAFGAGYEFDGDTSHIKNVFDFTKYRVHPRHKQKSGMYTDDTQMSIGVCKLLASDSPFNKLTLADSFVECFKRDPIDGYSRGFQAFLKEVSSGEEFLARIRGDSTKNGAAMRSVPLGLLPNVEDVVQCAQINASLTHNTPNGVSSSVCVALLSHHQFYELEDNFFDFIYAHGELDKMSLDYMLQVRRMHDLNPDILFGRGCAAKGVPCDGIKTAGAVLYLINKHGTVPSALLKQAILLGGDTDSVASIALGISAINSGLDTLPPFLLRDLTNHQYGKEYLVALGETLEMKFRLG